MVEIISVLAAVIVGTVSVARLTRLITQDSFPPSAWLRAKWDEVTGDGSWSVLAHCHWCLSVWITPAILLWGWLSDLHVAWWLFNGWMAASYVAAMIVERDEVE